MTLARFKVGDKVVVTSSTAYATIRAGHTGTVTEVSLTPGDLWPLLVDMDMAMHGNDWPFAVNEVEKMEAEDAATV